MTSPAALTSILADYQRAYARHREVQAELSELTTRARERAAEAEDLHRALEEIEGAKPAAGEDIALLAEEERLGHADALHAAATTAHRALHGDPSDGSYRKGSDAVTLLGRARQALDAVAAHDPELASLASRLSEAAYVISDVAAELASYMESLDSDPARLAAVQERRAELTRLIRAYGGQVAVAAAPGTGQPGDGLDLPAQEGAGPRGGRAGGRGRRAGAVPAVPGLASVLAWAQQAQRRLTEISGDDDRIGVLGAEEARLAGAVRDLGGKLTSLRKEAAERFAAAVTGELSALAMPHARITVAVMPRTSTARTARTRWRSGSRPTRAHPRCRCQGSLGR